MYEGYLDLAGNEVVNTARAVAYASRWGIAIGCNPCDTLAEATGDFHYSDPVSDDAPWYDPAVPESARFLGVVGLGVEGMSSAPIERAVLERVGDGGVLGTLRRAHREAVWNVGLIALDDAAMAYGMEWLSAVLRGTICVTATCFGDEACMLASCPGPAAPGQDVGHRETRTMVDVGIIEGPSVTERWYLSGRGAACQVGETLQSPPVLARAVFTLAAGRPGIFRPPVAQFREWWYLIEGVGKIMPLPTGSLPAPSQSCLLDPRCPEAPALPAVGDALATCGLWPPTRFPPLAQQPGQGPPGGIIPSNYPGRSTMIPISALDVPGWLTTVPVVTVESGSQPLYNLYLRFTPNPAEAPCADLRNANAWCSQAGITYLPANSVAVLDGRTQRATVDCPAAGSTRAQSVPNLVGGPDGSAFQWPEFECSTGLCIEAIVSSRFLAPDARIRIQLYPRSDAS